MEVLSTALYGLTAVIYTLSALTHLLLAFRHQWEGLARWATRGACFLHGLALLVLVIETGRVPVYTVFEAALLVTWLLVTGYVAVESAIGNQVAGAFVLPLVFVLFLATVSLPKPAGTEVLVANLPASLIFWHVSIILLGYMGLVGAFVTGCMYLILDYLLRRKTFHPIYYRLPSLESLDVWGHRSVVMGFPLLTLGVVAGLFFATLAWEQFWLGDPKVLWTLLNWCIYVGYLVTRRWGGWGGRKAAWWAIAGFAGVLVNYFIVNAFLTELHRFGI